jgi:hypothetical protein
MKYDRKIRKRGEQSLTATLFFILFLLLSIVCYFYLGEPDGMAGHRRGQTMHALFASDAAWQSSPRAYSGMKQPQNQLSVSTCQGQGSLTSHTYTPDQGQARSRQDNACR